MAHLLADMTIEAQLSLQPLLHLAGVMARDLQTEYLPLLPRFMDRVGGWVPDGEGGGPADNGGCMIGGRGSRSE